MGPVSTNEPSVARTDGTADPHLPRPARDDAQPEGDAPVRRPVKIPRSLLDEHALTVVRRLKRFGHEAYLVGGCVRDLLCGLEPKDFDVVTDAHPNRIKRIFRNARIIGRRFRLAHIRFGPDAVIETSTYRADPATQDVTGPEDAPLRSARAPRGGRRPGPPSRPGPPRTAAGRREHLRHGAGGRPAARLLDQRPLLRPRRGRDPRLGRRPRGPGGGGHPVDRRPVRRIREDPVRMIRAVHFAERMGFRLEPALAAAIRSEADQLAEASPARLYLELIKVLNRAKARPTLHRLHEMGVLEHWLPELDGELEASASWPESAGGTHEEASHGEPEDMPTAHATWNLLGAADHWGMGAHGADDALALAPLLGPWLLRASILPNRRPSFPHYAERFETTLRPLAQSDEHSPPDVGPPPRPALDLAGDARGTARAQGPAHRPPPGLPARPGLPAPRPHGAGLSVRRPGGLGSACAPAAGGVSRRARARPGARATTGAAPGTAWRGGSRPQPAPTPRGAKRGGRVVARPGARGRRGTGPALATRPSASSAAEAAAEGAPVPGRGGAAAAVRARAATAAAGAEAGTRAHPRRLRGGSGVAAGRPGPAAPWAPGGRGGRSPPTPSPDPCLKRAT